MTFWNVAWFVNKDAVLEVIKEIGRNDSTGNVSGWERMEEN